MVGDEWTGAVDWWRTEVADDRVFAGDVLPLLTGLFDGSPPVTGDGPWLDLGCGEGRVMRALACDGLVGCDLSIDLARTAAATAPVVRCDLPDLRWVRPGSLSGAYAVLVLEHLPDLPGLFSAVAKAVGEGGAFVVVANHPAFTAAGSGPIVDLTDGEVLWRWGPYPVPAPTVTELSPGHTVTFHHRPLGVLLTAAADAGWHLERCVEQTLSADVIAAEPGYEGQESIPRLLGVRWRRPPIPAV